MALALGPHGLNVNQGYFDHHGTRQMRDEAIRKFVDALSIITAFATEDVRERLGYSKEDVDAKVDGLIETATK